MKSYAQPRQHVKKQRHYFANKGLSSQSYGFSSTHVGMWQTIRKAEDQRINSLKLWCWRRLLRVPWTARRLNQSIQKESNPEYSLGRLLLKLELQYFGHLMWRADSLEKTLMLRKIEGRRRSGWQRMKCLDGITDSTDMSLRTLADRKIGKSGMLQSMVSQRARHDWVTQQVKRAEHQRQRTILKAARETADWLQSGESDGLSPNTTAVTEERAQGSSAAVMRQNNLDLNTQCNHASRTKLK